MQFSSLTFILFLGIVFALHYSIRSWKYQKINLLVASYLFYAAWHTPFILLLIISTLADWKLAQFMHAASTLAKRRILLILSLCVNLGLLSYFKYGDFLLDNFTQMMGHAGIDFIHTELDIILPIGISFYTFQTLSYTIDVYRGKLEPRYSLLDFSLFVTFFPQLVAGPIVRASDFLPQCEQPRRASMDQFGWGLALMAFGMFSKVILSDNILAPLADAGFQHANQLNTLDAWVTTLAFSGQIFFDFSGYSTTAVGAALCFGFILPDNFKAPYMAIGFSDFWRRWHISLSSWLKDYLYIPIGGNRAVALRVHANLLFTMLVGGLWHGASWLFVIWGGLHGAYLIIEHSIQQKNGGLRLPKSDLGQLALALGTFVIISITWIFFRAENLSDALTILGALFNLIDTPVAPIIPDYPAGNIPLAFILLILLLAWQWRTRQSNLEAFFEKLSVPSRTLLLSGVLLSLVFTSGGSDRAFIYFQF